MHVRVAEPEVVAEVRWMLDALREHPEPTLCVRPTVPVNPLRAVTVIIEFPGEPAFTTTRVGLATMVKSGGGGADVT